MDGSEPTSPSLPLPPTEPISSEAAQDRRSRRATYNPTSVDKVVLKGSMDKVLAPTTSILPLHLF
jgi:hypothetical protein